MTLRIINHGDNAKKEEVIRLWMSQEPTWIVLVDALSQSAYMDGHRIQVKSHESIVSTSQSL